KTTLTNKQRQDIIAYKSKNPNISNVNLAEWVKKEFKLDVHPTTIGYLIKNKDDIGSNPSTKRQRTVRHPELENSLLDSKTDMDWNEKEIWRRCSVNENVIAIAIPKLK
ncbi:23208_t:CDS:2, partial [Gigaspora margarita]